MNKEHMDFDFNATDCIRTATDFGKSVFHNICSGDTTVVMWGSADWALAILLLVIAVGIITFGVAVIRDLLLW